MQISKVWLLEFDEGQTVNQVICLIVSMRGDVLIQLKHLSTMIKMRKTKHFETFVNSKNTKSRRHDNNKMMGLWCCLQLRFFLGTIFLLWKDIGGGGQKIAISLTLMPVYHCHKPVLSSCYKPLKTCCQVCPPGYLMHFS